MVSGAEFETNRSCIASTKLAEEDELVAIVPLSAGQVLSGDEKVIMLTEKGLSLGYNLNEVSELKKTSRGVKGIALDKNDYVAFTGVYNTSEEFFPYNGHQYSVKKVRNRKRGAKGQKATLI